VFYKKNKAISFLEICLECDGTRQSEKTGFGDFCDEKMCKLQKFFQVIGVKGDFIEEKCK
jgi:hypothetical protein